MKCNGYEYNRFDICEAYYCFTYNYHSGQSSKEYEFLGRLINLGFKPGLNAHVPDCLTVNGSMIYENLRIRFKC